MADATITFVPALGEAITIPIADCSPGAASASNDRDDGRRSVNQEDTMLLRFTATLHSDRDYQSAREGKMRVQLWSDVAAPDVGWKAYDFECLPGDGDDHDSGDDGDYELKKKGTSTASASSDAIRLGLGPAISGPPEDAKPEYESEAEVEAELILRDRDGDRTPTQRHQKDRHQSHPTADSRHRRHLLLEEQSQRRGGGQLGDHRLRRQRQLVASIPLPVCAARNFSFTYRIQYAAGDIKWLGSYGHDSYATIRREGFPGLILSDEQGLPGEEEERLGPKISDGPTVGRRRRWTRDVEDVERGSAYTCALDSTQEIAIAQLVKGEDSWALWGLPLDQQSSGEVGGAKTLVLLPRAESTSPSSPSYIAQPTYLFQASTGVTLHWDASGGQGGGLQITASGRGSVAARAFYDVSCLRGLLSSDGGVEVSLLAAQAALLVYAREEKGEEGKGVRSGPGPKRVLILPLGRQYGLHDERRVEVDSETMANIVSTSDGTGEPGTQSSSALCDFAIYAPSSTSPSPPSSSSIISDDIRFKHVESFTGRGKETVAFVVPSHGGEFVLSAMHDFQLHDVAPAGTSDVGITASSTSKASDECKLTFLTPIQSLARKVESHHVSPPTPPHSPQILIRKSQGQVSFASLDTLKPKPAITLLDTTAHLKTAAGPEVGEDSGEKDDKYSSDHRDASEVDEGAGPPLSRMMDDVGSEETPSDPATPLFSVAGPVSQELRRRKAAAAGAGDLVEDKGAAKDLGNGREGKGKVPPPVPKTPFRSKGKTRYVLLRRSGSNKGDVSPPETAPITSPSRGSTSANLGESHSGAAAAAAAAAMALSGDAGGVQQAGQQSEDVREDEDHKQYPVVHRRGGIFDSWILSWVGFFALLVKLFKRPRVTTKDKEMVESQPAEPEHVADAGIQQDLKKEESDEEAEAAAGSSSTTKNRDGVGGEDEGSLGEVEGSPLPASLGSGQMEDTPAQESVPEPRGAEVHSDDESESGDSNTCSSMIPSAAANLSLTSKPSMHAVYVEVLPRLLCPRPGDTPTMKMVLSVRVSGSSEIAASPGSGADDTVPISSLHKVLTVDGNIPEDLEVKRLPLRSSGEEALEGGRPAWVHYFVRFSVSKQNNLGEDGDLVRIVKIAQTA